MNYGISCNGEHSLDDYGWKLVGRDDTPPKLRTVKVEVPYSNGALDYTGVYGDAFYGERTIVYRFKREFASVDACMEGVREFSEWLLGIYNAELHDGMFSEFHFSGSCVDVKPEHAMSGMAATVEASFECYPFMVADDVSEYFAIVGTNYVINEGRAVRLTVETSGSWSTVTIGDESARVTGKQVTSLCLEAGLNEVEVDGAACTLTWIEERM
ncbi:MAG: hypothetical protein IJ111_05755 [Eggerthellaceae bacterium]|nr:hypothetical protein [Eggerthellaceae bacterium]